MAVAAGSLRQRQKQQAQAAAKSKRDKIILAVGGVLLVLVLLFEIPKLMKGSGSSAPPAPAPAAGTPAPAAAATTAAGPTEAVVRKELTAIAKLPAKDPFKVQVGAGTASSTAPSSTPTAPHVRLHHFVLKNPFKVQVGAVSTATPAAPLARPPAVTPAKTAKAPAKTHAATSQLGYIVILRSLDTRASALQEAQKARAHGLTASVLYSSKYTTLRHGYWVVYLNKYPTQAAADTGLQQAHANGYASAYRRPVKK